MNYLKPLMYLALLGTIVSCSKKDDVGPVTNPTEFIDPAEGVLVLNEGAFLSNNASISFIHSDGKLSQNLFESVNNRPMGDVLQSVTETGTDYFFVVNNSGKIERVNKYTIQSIATISGFSSPRYLMIANNNKALVTNLYGSSGNTIDIVNLGTNEIESQIAVTGQCEEMVKVNGKIFVANTGDNKVLVIDVNSLEITNSIELPVAPVSMVYAKYGKIWVLSQEYNPVKNKLYRIDVDTETMEASFDTPNPDGFASKLRINSTKDRLYFIENGVYSMSVDDTSVPTEALIKNTFMGLYGLGVDPETGLIYVADARDFQSAGEVYIYNNKGESIGSFDAGIAPSDFSFR